MSVILKTEKLRVEFSSRELRQATKVALTGLDLAVNAGEVFGFLGPNGAGKTTTMNVLLGFVPPTSGAAYLFGIDVRQPIARQRIGYLPELTYYYKFLTAEELLRYYARIFKIPKAAREQRVDAVLKLVDLEHALLRLGFLGDDSIVGTRLGGVVASAASAAPAGCRGSGGWGWSIGGRGGFVLGLK